VNWENGIGKFLVGLGIFGKSKPKRFRKGFWWLGVFGVFGGWEFLGFLGFLAQNMAKMPQNRLFLAIVAIETIY
jgi:hypothetical protein